MQNVKKDIISFIRFFIAGIICFVAAYLSEKTMGAVATFPFIIILPAVTYLIYGKVIAITGMCALGGFIFHCILVTEPAGTVVYTLVCALYGLIASLCAKFLVREVKKAENKRVKVFGIACAIFVLTLVSYFVFHGTIFGLLSSKRASEDYLKEKYPDVDFVIDTAYFSLKDGCYLTEVHFNDRETYTAKISADKDGEAVIDGYRDYCEYRLLSTGLEVLREHLTYHKDYESIDYVVRYDKINSKDRITPESSYEKYCKSVSYEIAFYEIFGSKAAFERKCRNYADHLKDRGFEYDRITFYGYFNEHSKDFDLSLVCTPSTSEFKAKDFDKESFKRYKKDSDLNKYWVLNEA